MQFFLVSLAVSAVSVSALELFPGHQYIKHGLAARQTASSDDADYSAYYSEALACATALQSVYDGLPTAPPAIASFAATVSIDNPCSVTYPASIESAVSSYVSAVEDWYSSHSSEIESALSECPTYSGVGESSFGGDVCSTGIIGGGGTAATTTADDATTTGKTTKATTTGAATTGAATTATGTTTAGAAQATNAGNRETGGVAAAAMAVVGVLGVVAAL